MDGLDARGQNDPAVLDEDNVVQHALDVADQVRGEQDRRAALIIREDRIQYVVPRGGVHAADWLVKQIQARGAAHDENELHLFERALAHGAERFFRVDLQTAQHLFGALGAEIVVKILEKLDRVRDAHPAAQIRALRQIGNDALRFGAGQHPVDAHLAGRRREQAVCELDQRALARTVRPEQPHDAPGHDRKRRPVQGRKSAVLLAKPCALQNRHHGKSPYLPGGFRAGGA